MYEVFEHTADLGLRIAGGSREELFSEAGRALASLLVPNLEAVERVQERTLRIPGDQDDFLLLDWLTELLYVFETERLVFVDFEIQLTPGQLTAICRGEPLDLTRHVAGHEVKAITYHGLLVRQVDHQWQAEVIADI